MRKETTIRIEGMHCATCALAIEKSLRSYGGIEKAEVSLASNSAASDGFDRYWSMPSTPKIVGTHLLRADSVACTRGAASCAANVRIQSRRTRL